jgi:Protein of unknown function (DUF3311)
MAYSPPQEDGGRRHAHSRAWYWLLLVPLVGTLIPSIYNRHSPTIIGIPFFYWYQLAWIPISVLCIVLVYRATTGGDRR